ncbi:MAG TPA: hypothetical protein VK676_03180 [Steroidobacteraceae bacterium]|jgi:hypothetical protein|nr:hypothetical protein [Steroidobacteraceae bacterium]
MFDNSTTLREVSAGEQHTTPSDRPLIIAERGFADALDLLAVTLKGMH